MSANGSAHHRRLEAAYSEVGDATWHADDFVETRLASSLDLFTPESIASRSPVPKELEVVALLSGLPFALDFVGKLVAVQEEISSVLGKALRYWVEPGNLGVEYCVFKWPQDSWRPPQFAQVQDAIAAARFPAFGFEIRGVQINPDGCIVAKGFDENATLFSLREYLRSNIPNLPTRQSSWAHIPLGRILEPVGRRRFLRLSRFVEGLVDRPIASTLIDKLKLVHEKRWYMEDKTIVAEYALEAP